MPNKPSVDQLHQAISVVCKVIGQIPCFHAYEEYIAERFYDSEAEAALRATTHNAMMDSALLNIRCLNEFFKPDGQSDDIRSHHYDGINMDPFLSRDDEKEIHKHLAHLTIPRSEIDAKPWMLDKLVILGLEHGSKFANFIQTNFTPRTSEGRSEVQGIRKLASFFIPMILAKQTTEPTH